MNKKQKTTLVRIIITFVLYIAVMLLGHLDMLQEHSITAFGLYLVLYLFIGWDILFKAMRNITHGQIFDENFLMCLATFGALGCGEYPEAVAVMLFYQIGELFEGYAVGKSRNSIKDLMAICPEYANLEKDGKLEQVDPDEVAVGEMIVVKPGERVPLDGIVAAGTSMIDTSALTGESVPRTVKENDEIISGCINNTGVLHIKVTKAFEDSTVTKILELVENATSKKAKVENFITKFAQYYTPIVVCGAIILALMPPLLLGGGWAQWIKRACIFLVISCPCALVISVPLSFFGGIGAASRQGILIKGSNFLEALSQVDTIVFDKTGTLTKGEFKVTAVYPMEITEQRLLKLAAQAESYSDHPIAKSIIEASQEKIDLADIKQVKEISGHGVIAELDTEWILAGNEKLMVSEKIPYAPYTETGTIVYVARKSKTEAAEKRFLGTIVISDTVKEDAKQAIKAIKMLGVSKTVMLTGDKHKTAEDIGRQLAIDEISAELLPGDKVGKIETFIEEQKGTKRKTAFVGDGINDAPVLARADVGIAMGSMGSDAAIEAADVVLMDDKISKIPVVIKIAGKTMHIVKQNIVFALGVKILVLIVGALGMANMWEAVFADVGVLIIATLNAMRALYVK